MRKSQPSDHEDLIAENGFHSLSHYDIVHMPTISVKMITDLTWCRFNFFELIENCHDCNLMRFYFFRINF